MSKRSRARIFRAYNYHEIRTPIFEETSCSRAAWARKPTSSRKEMYTFDDRDGTSLTLRPENTASVIRAYIEHRLDQQPGRAEALLHRARCSAASVRKRAATGSSYQIGAEAIGSESPAVDAEVIEMVVEILARRRARGLPAADQLGRLPELPAAYSSQRCARS